MTSARLPKIIIIGSDYFTSSSAQKIAAKLEDAESHSYYAEELEPPEFFSLLLSPSLFHEYKLFTIKHAELIKKPETFLETAAKSATAAVILMSNDAKKSAALQKTAKAHGFELLVEEKKSTAAANSEIRAIFEANGLEISADTANKIALLTDGDLIKIRGEAEKLSLYFQGKKASADEIMRHISGTESEPLFAFLEAFMDRQKTRCLQNYERLEEKDRVFYMLTTYISALYFKLAQPSLYSPSNPLFNGKNYFMRTVDRVHRKWKAEEAASLIDKMAKLDLAVKTGRAESADSVLMLIQEL